MTDLYASVRAAFRAACTHSLIAVAVTTAALAGTAAPRPALAADYQGFGTSTPGGAGRPVVHVTNLNESGPGSLSEAVSQGGRYVVFDVAGTINLTSYIRVLGAFVTIDGSTAPAPGITLQGSGIAIEGTRGAHDVIVTGVRIRNAVKDGLRVAYGAYNVVIDHVSIQGSGDGNLDISESRDVTVQWSVIAQPAIDQKNMLIKYDPSHVTLHHNLFTQARQRNPQVRIDDAGTRATDTTVDMRNNVVWGWVGGYGTQVWYGPRANVVNNYYSSPNSTSAEQARALTVDKGTGASGARAYVEGNVSGDGYTTLVNSQGTEAVPFPAPAVDTQDTCAAAHDVLAGAGVRPLDSVDQRYLSAVKLAGCGSTTPPPGPTPMADLVMAAVSTPGSATAGATLSLSATTRNTGTASAGASTTRWYLSKDATQDSGDAVLASVSVPTLAAGASSSATTTVTLPSATAPGSWYLIARADATGAVQEGNEGNNTTAAPLTVAGSTGGEPTPGGTADLTVSNVSRNKRMRVGTAISVGDTVANGGTTAAAASVTKYYLSTDTTVGAGAVLVGSRSVPTIAAGGSNKGQTSITIPTGTRTGRYYLIAVADGNAAVAETREDNNTRAVIVKVE